MQNNSMRGTVTGVRLDDVLPLMQPWQRDPWGMLRPPVSPEALLLSCELAAATYDMDVEPWLLAGWQDVTIQVDGDLTTGLDLTDEDAGRFEKLAAKWRMRRVRTRIKQRGPLGQVVDAVRQIRESDTGKAVIMAHKAPDGRYVIAVSFMGTGERFYDWFSNFRISGENGMHKGFLQLARQFEENEAEITFPDVARELGLEKLTLLDILTEARRQDSRFLLWLSGHSQGGAVMQIWCREKIEAGGVLPANIVGYGFASPMVMMLGAEAHPEAYPLYHILNADDVFARIGARHHLGVALRYTPDEPMRQACYVWKTSEQAARARAIVRRILATIRDMPTGLVFVASYLNVLAGMSAEDMLQGALALDMRYQPLRKLVSAADSRIDSVLRDVSRHALQVYRDMTGSPMSEDAQTHLTAQITAAVDVLGIRAFSGAMAELFRYPHSINGKFNATPAYIYIAKHCIGQLQPMLPQHMLTAGDARTLPPLPMAFTSAVLARRRTTQPPAVRGAKRYSAAHPRRDDRAARTRQQTEKRVNG